MRIETATALFAALVSLIPSLGFTWGEGKNPIDHVGVYSIQIDSDYVFCGTNADWGANTYGVFLLDRKTGQWQNYSQANSRITNDIMAIAQVDSFIDVLAGIGTLRFKLPSMDYVFVDTNIGHRNLRFFRDSLAFDNRIYVAAGRSVVVKNGGQHDTVEVFKKSENPHYRDYYGGPIVTDCFVYDSLVIITTATRGYEGNITAAYGFLELSPQDLTINPWSGIELSNKPLALLCVEQDDKELWIGTNRGVYCVNKNNGESTHYNITEGVVVVETLAVFSDKRSVPPIIHEYYRGDTVTLLGEQEFSIEIALPQTYNGYLSSIYVKEEIDDVVSGRTVRIRDMLDLKDWGYVVTIKAADRWDSKTIAEIHYYYLPAGKQFKYISKHGDWYFITLPNTGWVPMKDLIFHMEEVFD